MQWASGVEHILMCDREGLVGSVGLISALIFVATRPQPFLQKPKATATNLEPDESSQLYLLVMGVECVVMPPGLQYKWLNNRAAQALCMRPQISQSERMVFGLQVP